MESSTLRVLEDFKNDLLGLYHNRYQAYSNPSHFAFIWAKFYEEDGVLKSKSWHHTYGEASAYRIFSHTLSERNGHVIMTNYNEIENSPTCDLTFIRRDNWWIANGSCIIPEKNTIVRTYIQFNGKEYHSRDGGYDLITQEYRWGKREDETPFMFVKQ